MKFNKHIAFAILVAWQVSANAESNHKHEEKEDKAHAEEHHDDHKGEEGHEEREEHGAHEHGAAHMTIAVGGKGLEIELETPAANILGFEHEATSAEDKKTLSEKKAKLEDVAALFTVNKEANCAPEKAEIKSALFEDHDEHDDDHKDEKHEEHADHKDDKHDDHKDEKHEEHEGETHNDIDAHWTFTCKDPKAIKNVSVNMFSAFPKGFENIKVDWITDTSASSVALEKDGMISFK